MLDLYSAAEGFPCCGGGGGVNAETWPWRSVRGGSLVFGRVLVFVLSAEKLLHRVCGHCAVHAGVFLLLLPLLLLLLLLLLPPLLVCVVVV